MESMGRPRFSVIIPVYQEEERIAALLAHVAGLTAQPGALGGVEVLVVDGDPERRTLRVMSEGAAILLASIIPLASGKGRARQMNLGAAQARGEVLLFLHADTRLPRDIFAHINAALAEPNICGGAFRLRIVPESGPPRLGLRFIAWAANLRSKFFRAPYGDQAIFLRREVFESLDGFPDIPLMEDLELMTRIRRSGRRIRLLDACASTSARRWESEGLWRCTGRNLLLRALYHLGVGAQRLAGFYK
jgi:rSAM/selenodomain-associated transferase 2